MRPFTHSGVLKVTLYSLKIEEFSEGRHELKENSAVAESSVARVGFDPPRRVLIEQKPKRVNQPEGVSNTFNRALS